MKRFAIYKFIFLIFFCFFCLTINGQNRLQKLIHNKNFNWVKDSLSDNVFIYSDRNGISEADSKEIKKIIASQIKKTKDFLQISEYEKPVHYFIVENRERMKLLSGRETNGTANYKENYIIAIYSQNINSVSSNHELFHLMAMNIWGTTKLWLNEGMAVYSDGFWSGYSLDELSKYLTDHKRSFPLTEITARPRKYDSRISYPILGSFVKFLDQQFGRKFIIDLWKDNSKINKTGLKDLERKWIVYLDSIKYNNINY